MHLQAQSFQLQDLSSSGGRWEGQLTYLDYSSGKPFTMLANIEIHLMIYKNAYIMSYVYPKEPHANSNDTIYVTDHKFGEEHIVTFEKGVKGAFKMITEKEGEDGNDHKKAVLRHTYLYESNTFSIVKEVRFESTQTWIKRNEYVLHRARS